MGEASWLGICVETLNWSSSPAVLCGRSSYRLINSLIIHYKVCAHRGVAGRAVLTKLRAGAAPRSRGLSVGDAQNASLPRGFIPNVLSFNGLKN